jgi:hypothetical protein
MVRKNSEAKILVLAAKGRPKGALAGRLAAKVLLDCHFSNAYVMFFSRGSDMGEHRREGASTKGDDLAPRSAGRAVVSTPQSKLSWRETVEGSQSHARSAARVRIGVTLAETAETSRTIPLSARSLRGARHSADWRIACGNCGNSPWSAHGRWPGISERACAQNSACNVLFQPECNRVP